MKPCTRRDFLKASIVGVAAGAGLADASGGLLRAAEPSLRLRGTDMVALGRQSFADPLLPLKLREGREKEINYCTACDNCLELLIQQSPIGCCTYNKFYTGVLVKTRKEKGRLAVDHT